jgi:hypothetical protein
MRMYLIPWTGGTNNIVNMTFNESQYAAYSFSAYREFSKYCRSDVNQEAAALLVMK